MVISGTRQVPLACMGFFQVPTPRKSQVPQTPRSQAPTHPSRAREAQNCLRIGQKRSHMATDLVYCSMFMARPGGMRGAIE